MGEFIAHKGERRENLFQVVGASGKQEAGLLLNRRVVVIDIPALLQVIAETPAFQTIFHLYPLLSYFTNSAPVRSVPWEGTLLAADAADVI